MSETLNEKARGLVEQPVLASVATVSADGSPQITPVWIDHEDGNLVFNTAQGRAKANNLARDPRVAICIVDPEDPYNVVVVRGAVEGLVTEGADEHIDGLAMKYLGVDEYPMRQPGEVRVKATVRADRVVMQPSN